MKKSLLLLVAAAATMIGASAANVNLLPAARVIAPHKLAIQEAAPVAANHGARVAAKASKTVNDIVGNYVWNATYADTSLTDGGSAVITKLSADSVKISGLWNGNNDVKAAFKGDTLYIPCQVAYTSSTYGTCSIVCIFEQNGSLYYSKTRPIKGVVLANGNIKILDMSVLLIDSGTYAGYSISYTYNPFVLEHVNGVMAETYNKTYSSSKTDTSFPVLIKQVDDSTVTVNNFANFGSTFTIKLAADSTITIPSQLVFTGGSTQGDFYTHAADWSKTGASSLSDLIAGDVISGKGTADALSWGNWCITSSKGYWTGALETGKVSYTDGTKFRFPKVKSAVEDVTSAKQVVSKSYFNLAGQASAEPFEGINIVVTRFADGSTQAAKILK